MKANYLPHLAGRVFGVPLLIQPQKLSVILQAIGPRLGLPPGEIEIEGLGVPVAVRECRWTKATIPTRWTTRPGARSRIW